MMADPSVLPNNSSDFPKVLEPESYCSVYQSITDLKGCSTSRSKHDFVSEGEKTDFLIMTYTYYSHTDCSWFELQNPIRISAVLPSHRLYLCSEVSLHPTDVWMDMSGCMLSSGFTKRIQVESHISRPSTSSCDCRVC